MFKMTVLLRTEGAPGCSEPFCYHSDPPRSLFSFRLPCLKLSNQGDISILLLSTASNNQIHYSVRVTMTSFWEANIHFFYAFLHLTPEERDVLWGSDPGCALENRFVLDCIPALGLIALPTWLNSEFSHLKTRKGIKRLRSIALKRGESLGLSYPCMVSFLPRRMRYGSTLPLSLLWAPLLRIRRVSHMLTAPWSVCALLTINNW